MKRQREHEFGVRSLQPTHEYNTIQPQDYVDNNILYTILQFIDRKHLDIMWFMSKRVHSIINNIVKDNIVYFKKRKDGSYPMDMFGVTIPISSDDNHFIHYQTLHGEPIGLCSVPFGMVSCLNASSLPLTSAKEMNRNAFNAMLIEERLQMQRRGYHTLTSKRGEYLEHSITYDELGDPIFLKQSTIYKKGIVTEMNHFDPAGELTMKTQYSDAGIIQYVTEMVRGTWEFTEYEEGQINRIILY